VARRAIAQGLREVCGARHGHAPIREFRVHAVGKAALDAFIGIGGWYSPSGEVARPSFRRSRR
jgi:hypothetical protein